MFFHDYWWIFPLIMIIVCFLFMRGSGICGCGTHNRDKQSSESARDILYKRYANGEIDRTEYEEKMGDLNRNT